MFVWQQIRAKLATAALLYSMIRQFGRQRKIFVFPAASKDEDCACHSDPLIMKMLCCSQAEGQKLDDNEVKAAIKLLDKNNDGFIEFDEFVSWWQNKVGLQLPMIHAMLVGCNLHSASSSQAALLCCIACMLLAPQV